MFNCPVRPVEHRPNPPVSGPVPWPHVHDRLRGGRVSLPPTLTGNTRTGSPEVGFRPIRRDRSGPGARRRRDGPRPGRDREPRRAPRTAAHGRPDRPAPARAGPTCPRTPRARRRVRPPDPSARATTWPRPGRSRAV